MESEPVGFCDFHPHENIFSRRGKIKASSSSGEIDRKSYKYTSVKKKL